MIRRSLPFGTLSVCRVSSVPVSVPTRSVVGAGAGTDTVCCRCRFFLLSGELGLRMEVGLLRPGPRGLKVLRRQMGDC